MNIKDVKLIKGMSKKEVNNLISEALTLEDDVYLGNRYKHNWKCKCGNVFSRKWGNIRHNKSDCGCVKYNKEEQRYRYEVEKMDEYEYIRSFRNGDILPNGDVVKGSPYLQIKHKYCGNVYEVPSVRFIHLRSACQNCCNTYENSFAYHIERELGEPLDKYWDFEKNTVNPYHITKYTHTKVWIKCQEKDYHSSYEIRCDSFTRGSRCSYCYPSGKHPKVHLLDSFGYKHFDKVQSWHPDNDISPFKVSPGSNNKFKFTCETCGHVWDTVISNISRGYWCPQCSSSKGERRINDYLKMNSIEFVNNEPYFNDLLSDKNKPLRPDFILPDHKIWIEYDGEFHYKKIYNNDSHEVLKIHDKRKDEYAKEHGWKMIRIPYWDFDNIEKILKDKLNI